MELQGRASCPRSAPNRVRPTLLIKGAGATHTHVMPLLLRFGLVLALVALLALRGQAAQQFTFGNWLVAPLRVHLLTSSNAPAVHTTLTERDVHRIVKKINGVWSQAGISLWLESIVREESLPYTTNMGAMDNLHGLLKLRPEGTRATNMFHLYYIKRFAANGVYLGEAMFVKDSASLREVQGGLDEPLPRVSSHEIGHALTLQHCTNEHHLMFRGTTGWTLDEEEIAQARAAAAKIPWITPALVIAQMAGKTPAEARQCYLKLSVIPLENENVRLAREKTAAGL